MTVIASWAVGGTVSRALSALHAIIHVNVPVGCFLSSGGWTAS
jgi:hypothetical protein